VIVLDTPPSRNALDFLDAPGRLLGFLEGRALQVFLGPSGLTTRVFGRGTALVFAIFARVTGVDMLGELSRFFRSLSGVTEGFGRRTREVAALLRAPHTTFAIVTSPALEPAREAEFLLRRLAASDMAVGELIVNRVHTHGLHGMTEAAVSELLAPTLGAPLAGRVAHNLADFDVLAVRDRETIARLSEAWGARQPIVVPHLDEDVQDLLGLARIAEHLFD
jgi:anion-transporting  ArsA/GET3 family ATPase